MLLEILETANQRCQCQNRIEGAMPSNFPAAGALRHSPHVRPAGSERGQGQAEGRHPSPDDVNQTTKH